MTIHLFARGNRATSITTLAVLGVMALLIAPSTPARAADGRPTPTRVPGAVSVSSEAISGRAAG